MTLADASTLIRERGDRVPGTSMRGMPYLSWQNDSLRAQAPGLMADIRPFPFSPWSSLADAGGGGGAGDGMGAEAVNIWIGDERSCSAIHKDNYENLYAVVAGEKVFTLLPPCEVLWLYERRYPTGAFQPQPHDGGDGDGDGDGDEQGGAARSKGGAGSSDAACAEAVGGSAAVVAAESGDSESGSGWCIAMDPLPVPPPDADHGDNGGASAAASSGAASGGAGAGFDESAAAASLRLRGSVASAESAEPLHLRLEPHRPNIPRCCAASAVLRRQWRWSVPPLPSATSGHDLHDAVAAASGVGERADTFHARKSVLQRRLESTCATQPWIGVDPWAPRSELARRFPLYARYASSATVRVRAGEVLYLPALWYHQVSQTCYTVAVNMWHDADFCGPAWAYYSMCKALAPAVQASWSPDDR